MRGDSYLQFDLQGHTVSNQHNAVNTGLADHRKPIIKHKGWKMEERILKLEKQTKQLRIMVTSLVVAMFGISCLTNWGGVPLSVSAQDKANKSSRITADEIEVNRLIVKEINCVNDKGKIYATLWSNSSNYGTLTLYDTDNRTRFVMLSGGNSDIPPGVMVSSTNGIASLGAGKTGGWANVQRSDTNKACMLTASGAKVYDTTAEK